MTNLGEHASTLQAVLEAFARGDVAGVMAYYDDDAVVVQYVDPPEERSGRAAIEALLSEMAEQISDMEYELLNAVEDDGQLAAEVLMRSTPKGETEPVETRYGAFMEFQNGKIRVEHLYPVSV